MGEPIHAVLLCISGLLEEQIRDAIAALLPQIANLPESGPNDFSARISLSWVDRDGLKWVLIQPNFRDDIRLPQASYRWHTRAEHESGTPVLFGSLIGDDVLNRLPPAQAKFLLGRYA